MIGEHLVNGRSGTVVSPDDRGLTYGDGLFETVAVIDGEPRLWERHMDRMEAGARRLGMPPPPLTTIREEVRYLVRKASTGALKVLYTRGPGEGRGYRTPGRPLPTRILTLHEPPGYPPEYWQGADVRICETRLAPQARLAGLKHLNRLEQVLARSEWRDLAIAEGLMLDNNGFLVEGTATNIFAVRAGALITPPLDEAGVDGVVRQIVLKRAKEWGLPTEIRRIYPEEIPEMEEMFLTNSMIGLWPVRSVEGRPVARGPVADRFLAELAADCFVPPGIVGG